MRDTSELTNQRHPDGRARIGLFAPLTFTGLANDSGSGSASGNPHTEGMEGAPLRPKFQGCLEPDVFICVVVAERNSLVSILFT